MTLALHLVLASKSNMAEANIHLAVESVYSNRQFTFVKFAYYKTVI